MSNYTPRLTEPGYADPNWLHLSYGGTNSCIRIDNASVLPNCVGYVYGRWSEFLGGFHNLPRCNAEDFIYRTSYATGTVPKLGAVICWRKGSAGVDWDGAGHVAIVEQINPDGSIVTSNSAYMGSRFYLRTLYPPFSMGGSYTFQGFIYPPVEFSNAPTVPERHISIDQWAQEVIAGLHGIGEDRKSRLGDLYEEVQNRVNEILAGEQEVKSTDILAQEVIAGVHGNGDDRRHSLGNRYDEVQARVNELINAVDYYEVARAVIRGDYGNGQARKDALIADGIDPVKVQQIVNELM